MHLVDLVNETPARDAFVLGSRLDDRPRQQDGCPVGAGDHGTGALHWLLRQFQPGTWGKVLTGVASCGGFGCHSLFFFRVSQISGSSLPVSPVATAMLGAWQPSQRKQPMTWLRSTFFAGDGS